MTNKQAIEAWLENPMRTVKNGSRSLYSHSGVLFSYGPHWPLAMVEGGTVYLNGDDYSQTTARHAGLVRTTATRMGMTVKRVDGDDMSARVASGLSDLVAD